jgi:hypothetical protein
MIGKRAYAALSIAAMMTAGLPIWFIGRSIVESKNLLSASRFGIPTMFGASLLSFCCSIISSARKQKESSPRLSAGAGANFHLDNTQNSVLMGKAGALRPATALARAADRTRHCHYDR